MFLSTMWQPDDDGRALAEDVRIALDGWLDTIQATRAFAAETLGVRPDLLGQWLSCQRSMNLFRLTRLPKQFWVRFLELRAARVGAVLVPPQVVVLLAGLVADPKRIARMQMALRDAHDDERKSA